MLTTVLGAWHKTPIAARSAWLILMITLFVGSAVAGPVPYFQNLEGERVQDIVLGPEVSKPGVLYILIDTLRPDFLGAYGNPRATSPFIDSLAANGVVFANHFSSSTWTKPSVTSLLTGLYPRRHNVLPINSKLAWRIPTIAQVFKQAGFATGAVVGNKFAGRRYGLHKGFDRYLDPSNHFKGPFPSAEEVLRIAKRWIALDKDKPFFYFVLLVDPHDPYEPSPYYRDGFCPTCQKPEVVTPKREYSGRGPSEKQIDDMKSLYSGEIRYMDDQLKLFFDSLAEMGVTDRLSTVIVGDHGEAFGEHGVFEHAYHCWDEVVRTPLIINSPRVSDRGIYSGLTTHVDVFPTLLELAGIERIEGLQGISLVQEPDDPPPPSERMVATEVQMYGIHRTIVRDEQYKLVRHDALDETEFRQYYNDTRIYPSLTLGTGKEEVYDVLMDPMEQVDIYQSERGVALMLERRLEHYLLTGDVDEEVMPETPSDEVLQDLKSLGYYQ